MATTKKNSELQEVISYTLPRLYEGKDWYIGFYAYNPIEKKLKIKRIKVNHIQKIGQRRKYSSELILRLTEKLRRGWNPWIESDNSKAYTTFDEACESYSRVTTQYYKEDLYREGSFVSYMSYLRNLVQYNKKLKNPITYIYQFDKDYINDFLEHIFIDRENTPQTRDNYLMWLKVFCHYLVKRGYHKTLATDGIDSFGARCRKKTRTTIPEDKLNELRKYSEQHNKHYLLACYILFYCFIRPKEMAYIKIEDISLNNRTIFISEDVSKNRKSAVVTLNHKVIDLMLELRIFDEPGNYYLFSTGYKPGHLHHDEKQFRDYWNKYIRRSLRFKKEYKFYSLKDTGVTMMLRKHIDNLSVRDQARHSSILITDTYTPHDIQEANPVIEKFDTSF